jgi:cytochrome b561
VPCGRVESAGTVADGELPTWLKWHRSLQISGAAVGVAGYGIAKAMTEHHSHALWISFHHKIGALLTLYSIVQLCLGLFRPHAPTKAEGKTRRREVWEAVHKKGGYVVMSLALVQVFVGAALAPDFAGSAELTWVVVCAVTVVGTLSFGLMASKMTTEFRGVAPAPAPSPVPEQGAEASTAADAESSRNP